MNTDTENGMRVELLIIDPQNDFCDPDKGALYIGGAEHDVVRLARMVRRLAPRLNGIHVTLDSHHSIDIAHPIFWRDSRGTPPAPFTTITAADVESGRWTTAQPAFHTRALHYTQALDAYGRYQLTIWPPHCLIGGAGHAVMPELFDALTEWEERRFIPVDYITKGSNIFTEHYSAVQAEVPDPDDPSTQINTGLIRPLMGADLIAVAGEAGSHCVANTVRDLADNGDGALVSKLVLLTDATCPVAGFEIYQSDFIREMTARGMRLSTTTEFLA